MPHHIDRLRQADRIGRVRSTSASVVVPAPLLIVAPLQARSSTVHGVLGGYGKHACSAFPRLSGVSDIVMDGCSMLRCKLPSLLSSSRDTAHIETHDAVQLAADSIPAACTQSPGTQIRRRPSPWSRRYVQQKRSPNTDVCILQRTQLPMLP